MLSGVYEFLPQDRVIFGRTAPAAVAETADRMAKRRLLIVASRTLNRQTDVVAKIRSALGDRCVGVFDECVEHVPRASVLALASAVRNSEPDLIVTVGGGTPIDTVKVMLLALAAGIDDEAGFDGVPDSCRRRRHPGRPRDQGSAGSVRSSCRRPCQEPNSPTSAAAPTRCAK